jgi:hypothetical protein
MHCGARVQRLALLTTLMLACERLPPTAAADEFVGLASAVAALPSGLLAMVGGAITLLDSELEVRPVSEHCRALQSTGANRVGSVAGVARTLGSSLYLACEGSLS